MYSLNQSLAEKHETFIVHTHDVFLHYLENDDRPLTIDGVPLSSIGDMLVAKTWVKVAQEILEA